MKRFAFAAFIAFWASAATLLAVSLLMPAATTAQEEATVYTLQEIAEHDTAEDCWMAIEGRVYDFTEYLPSHPAPPVIMTGWCGREATEGMTTKGYGNSHSDAAWEMMAPYLIGVLAED
ncbi:MAG: cytochrome b5-like heme/steroid binding domain-containing protein [Pseudohongiellaceae bacterium]